MTSAAIDESSLVDNILNKQPLKESELLAQYEVSHKQMEFRHKAANLFVCIAPAWGVFGSTFANTCLRWPGGPDQLFWTIQGYFAAVLTIATLRLIYFNEYAYFCSTQARWQHELEAVLLFSSLTGVLSFLNIYAYTASFWPTLFAFLSLVSACVFYMATFWTTHKFTCKNSPGYARYELWAGSKCPCISDTKPGLTKACLGKRCNPRRTFFNVIDGLWVLSWFAFIVLVAQYATDITLPGRPDGTNNSTACMNATTAENIVN